MNIQIFIDGNEYSLLSVDMTKVEGITEVDACVSLKPSRAFIKKLSEYPMKDINERTVFAIDAMLHMPHNSCRACLLFTADELWDELGCDDAKKYTKAQKADSLAENFTDEEALRLMVRYWKDMADTPLTKKIIGENRFRVPQNKETHEQHEEAPDDPNVCKKLRVGLYKGDGTLMFEEIVYPGFMNELEANEIDDLGDTIDFPTVIDDEHPDMIVTDDIICLSERMCQEWGELTGWTIQEWGTFKGWTGEEYVAHVLDLMISGQIKADKIRIDGSIFNAEDNQYIVAERYTKDIVYTEQTNEFMKKIGKELKK